MRPLRLLLLYVLAVFLGGALLAPWAWKGVQWAAAHGPVLQPLAQQPFHRFVNRCLLATALAGLWPLCRTLSPGPSQHHGWVGTWPRPLAIGAGMGIAALGSILLAAALSKAAVLHSVLDLAPVARRVLSSLATAAAVATVEEWLFRGIIHGALRRSLSFPVTATITSLLYALVHFFDRPPAPPDVNAATGLWTLGQMLRGFLDIHALVPGLLNLFVAGWTLALARERSGSLALPIGIHAGWVLTIKGQSAFVAFAASSSPTLWGSHKVFDGYAASLALAIQLLVVHRLARRPPMAAAT